MKKEDVNKLAAELNVDIKGMKFFEAKSAVLNAQKNSNSSQTNVAVVLRPGNHEVRRYTLDTHGKNFRELAEEFASQRSEYQVKMVKAEDHSIECPDCGKRFTIESTD